MLLCNALAMGEFGAVSVVSGHIRGLTNMLPLHVEILSGEYDISAAFAVPTPSRAPAGTDPASAGEASRAGVGIAVRDVVKACDAGAAQRGVSLDVERGELLLDEPFGALDARIRKDLRRWLREIHERTGRTTAFVTHDQDEAMELADRVAILNAGRIEQVGRPAEIHAEPRTAFLASLVGDPTALDVAVAAGRVRLGGFDIGTAPARQFLRPGDAALGSVGEGVPARVENLLWASRGARAEVTVGGLPQRLDVDLPDAGDVRVGDVVGLRFHRLRIYPSP